MKTTLLSLQLAFSIYALTFCLGDSVTNAQSPNVARALPHKDTVALFSDRLKITLTNGAFKEQPKDLCVRKYARLFNLRSVTDSRGFVLNKKDTLVFFLTSVERPTENDGGISTWELINSVLDKIPSYRMESGWRNLGRDYLYFVRLVVGAKPNSLFEFNFFFVDSKLMFSLLQRPIKAVDTNERDSFMLITAR